MLANIDINVQYMYVRGRGDKYLINRKFESKVFPK